MLQLEEKNSKEAFNGITVDIFESKSTMLTSRMAKILGPIQYHGNNFICIKINTIRRFLIIVVTYTFNTMHLPKSNVFAQAGEDERHTNQKSYDRDMNPRWPATFKPLQIEKHGPSSIYTFKVFKLSLPWF